VGNYRRGYCSGISPAAQQIVINAGETVHGRIVRAFLGSEALHVVVELEPESTCSRTGSNGGTKPLVSRTAMLRETVRPCSKLEMTFFFTP
jgi:hypothetical protein